MDPVGLDLIAEATVWTGMTPGCWFVCPHGAALLSLLPKDLVTLLSDQLMNKARSTAGRSVCVLQELMVDFRKCTEDVCSALPVCMDPEQGLQLSLRFLVIQWRDMYVAYSVSQLGRCASAECRPSLTTSSVAIEAVKKYFKLFCCGYE